MRARLIILYMLLSVQICAQINIWSDYPDSKKVIMTPYLTDGDNNTAVVVCPGGSYFWHDMKTEGEAVASWLNENGISAFVLRYRTAYVPAFLFRFRYVFRGNRYPDPQDDLKQAIKYIKDHSEEFRINPNHVGAMGFSAGGHLVMSAAEFFEEEDKPFFVAPIYPVVTMTEDCVHKRSRRALLGDSRVKNKVLRDSLSLEKHVPADCPPVFLVNCKDDPIVDYRNSVLLDKALTEKNIPHLYIQYETGGHGFGASESKGTPESREWKIEFINWINRLLDSGY